MTSFPASDPSRTGPKIGRTAVPRASVAPPLACIVSIRPMPATRFQLTPQFGAARAIMPSALRYADNAIAGIRRAPGEFTTTAGGGAETVATATWKLVGGLLIPITDGPASSSAPGITAANGVTLTS